MLSPIAPLPPPDARNQVLRAKAMELEARFLAEMLRHAGAGTAPQGFDGGVGEEQFASFLREAQADAIVRRGGIGLAEHLFNALKDRENVTG